MTIQQGKITSWKDDKGFGFITPTSGGREVFFHISDVSPRYIRPSASQAVTFTVSYDQQQRPRAYDVQLASRPNPIFLLAMSTVCLFFLILTLATYTTPLPFWLLIAYVCVSLFTFITYSIDKRSAVQGAQRVPEATLHLLELLGGWPGALLAQYYFRHKTKKSSYQCVYWSIVVLHLALLTFVGIVGRIW